MCDLSLCANCSALGSPGQRRGGAGFEFGVRQGLGADAVGRAAEHVRVADGLESRGVKDLDGELRLAMVRLAGCGASVPGPAGHRWRKDVPGMSGGPADVIGASCEAGGTAWLKALGGRRVRACRVRESG